MSDRLSVQLDRLAAFDSGASPVISLYLNMQPDQHGRDNFEPFLRKELADRVRTFGADGPERKGLERDAERIRAYVERVDGSVNGLAVFACSGADLFEPIPLAAPFHEHRLYISGQPHLYPLARVLDAYPRYAVLLADTRSARLFVVAENTVREAGQVEGTRTKRHKMGGWAQARYQRHVANYHAQHAKEVVDALARIVRDEDVEAIILAGDEVVVPLLRAQMPKELSDRVVDVLKLDIRTGAREVLDATIAAMHEKEAETDREKVEQLLDAYRANGLAVVGLTETARALQMGQVDELIITAVPEGAGAGAATSGESSGGRVLEERAADELVVKARQTAANIRFIDDASLLAAAGGVGALLRFKL